jgi:cholesterol transport system auxiliary component
MKISSALRAPWIFAAALAWSACMSGPAPRDHFYRLEIEDPTASDGPRIDGTLEVDRLRVEALAEGRRILYRSQERPGEVAQYAYHRWSDPPSVMVQDRLVDYLRAAHVARTVVTPAVRVAADYVVDGRILRFEQLIGNASSRAVVEIELILTRVKGRQLLQLATYREERTARSNSVADAVQAFDGAVQAIFERFVADLPQL